MKALDPQWQHARGALFTSPDKTGRASVPFSVVAKVAHDIEQIELAACPRVGHRYQGLEDTAFQIAAMAADVKTVQLNGHRTRRPTARHERAARLAAGWPRRSVAPARPSAPPHTTAVAAWNSTKFISYLVIFH